MIESVDVDVPNIQTSYYLRIENAGRLCFDRRVFICLFIYLFVSVLFAKLKKY